MKTNNTTSKLVVHYSNGTNAGWSALCESKPQAPCAFTALWARVTCGACKEARFLAEGANTRRAAAIPQGGALAVMGEALKALKGQILTLQGIADRTGDKLTLLTVSEARLNLAVLMGTLAFLQDNAAPRGSCADCGEEGERAGHQTCQYPRNHR